METLRDALERIGIDRNAPFSIRDDLQSFPPSLRQLMAATQNPGEWRQVNEVSRDQVWTDEVQGVAHDGEHWIFCCNANQGKPGTRDKALYHFPNGSTLKDGGWSHELVFWRDVPSPIAAKESNHHWGQPAFFNGQVFISHFWQDADPVAGHHVVVLDNNGGAPTLNRWIELLPITSGGRTDRPEFQAINPWDGQLYSSFGGGDLVSEFFIHDMADGKWTGKSFKFQEPLPCNIQGACFSGNGHLFVVVDQYYNYPPDDANKFIFCYSALNGKFLSSIAVLAELSYQELEGICVAHASWPDGRQAQVHAVLLENHDVAKDNLFFKSFCADVPSAV